MLALASLLMSTTIYLTLLCTVFYGIAVIYQAILCYSDVLLTNLRITQEAGNITVM